MKYILSISTLLAVAFFPLVWGSLFHSTVPFNSFYYTHAYHIYIPDFRSQGQPFNLVNSLAQADAQWYLKIAHDGYPKNPTNIAISDKHIMDGLTYAFFPLYPLIVSLVNFLVFDISTAAFILMLILLVANVFSLHQVVGFKPALLLLSFPFSIFLRSYFTESLQLLLLTWIIYSLHKNKLLSASILVGLITVTKGTSLLLLPIVWYKIVKSNKTIAVQFVYIVLSLFPLVAWSIFNFLNTNDPIFFISVRDAWFSYHPLIFLHNLWLVITTSTSPLHKFHYSQIENLMFILILVIITRAKAKMDTVLWSVMVALALLPILTSDLTSFSRYQSINIPLFVFLASQKKPIFLTVLALSLIGLAFLTPYFLSWSWVG